MNTQTRIQLYIIEKISSILKTCEIFNCPKCHLCLITFFDIQLVCTEVDHSTRVIFCRKVDRREERHIEPTA